MTTQKDFNDLHQSAGPDAVRACIEVAINSVVSCAVDKSANGTNELWPDPTPLPNALPPVESFDAELLPVALRAWVMDIAHLMQCPPDFQLWVQLRRFRA